MTERRLTLTAAVFAVLGLAIAGYLTYVHYAGLTPVCAGAGGGCERVQNSDYARLAGVPVALLGLIGYLTIVATLFVPGEPARLAATTLALIGLGFSGYLTYLELHVIHAICQWCVASAVVMTALAAILIARLLIDPRAGTNASHPSGGDT